MLTIEGEGYVLVSMVAIEGEWNGLVSMVTIEGEWNVLVMSTDEVTGTEVEKDEEKGMSTVSVLISSSSIGTICPGCRLVCLLCLSQGS